MILQSRFPKGWTPRTPAQGTHAEHPGTTVLWDELHFEVVEATPLESGGVRYVLMPWAEHHAIRTFEAYDEASEARRLEEWTRAEKQRQVSVAARLSGFVLGHLPASVQEHLQNELGVRASRMTLLSCIPPMIVVGVCVHVVAGAYVRQVEPPIPTWIFPFLGLLLIDSFVRFYVAMTQPRGMGSVIGTPLYILYWLVSPHRERLVPPFTGKGESSTFTIPPPDDVALRDELELKGALLTLLAPAEQAQLAERYGFDYRRHAFGITWTFLVIAVFGAVSSWLRVADGQVSAIVSLLLAAAIAGEQVLRLRALQRGPAGSMFAPLVRPFARNLLTARN